MKQMRRIGLAAALLAALFAFSASTSAAVSPSDYKNASKFCKALKAELNSTVGPTAFKDAYGTNKNKSNAHGKCVSKFAKVQDKNQSDASKDCKTERGDTPESVAAFNEKYGTGKNKKNALGRCISQKAGDASDQQEDAVVNAAKQCKTERGNTADSREAFRNKYGTNKNKRNAFGKCVSRHVRGEI
jgi:hypothetical protein